MTIFYWTLALLFEILKIPPSHRDYDMVATSERRHARTMTTHLIRPPVILDANSIAIVGASPDESRLGGKPMAFLKRYGYSGTVYPVNPRYAQIADYRCYPSLRSIPAPVDHAIVVVPAARVLSVLQDAAAMGIPTVTIFSSGFAEVGAEGRDMQDHLAQAIGATPMRVIGPNSVGLANLTTGFLATFSQAFELSKRVPTGPIGFASQSGAFGTVILTLGVERGLGFKYFACTGNEADVTISDVMQAMVEDPDVRIVAGYVEGLRDGRRFLDVCEKARSQQKPVIVLKVGRTDWGQQAALSHTAALAGADRVYTAAFQQAGVLRAMDEQELLDWATMFYMTKRPAGAKVAVVTMSGGAGVAMADEVVRSGLQWAQLTSDTRQRLSAVVPAFGSTQNPVDLTGQFLEDTGALKRIVLILDADPQVDVVALFIGLGHRHATQIVDDVTAASAIMHKPLVMAWAGGPQHARLQLMGVNIPVIASPARSIRALSAFVRFHQTQDLPYHGWRHPSANFSPSLGGGPIPTVTKRLSESSAKAILGQWGIQHPPEYLVSSETEACQRAADLGYPVALKVSAPALLHKTEIGGVSLDLANEPALRSAYRALLSRMQKSLPDGAWEGVLVSKMAPPGLDLILSGGRDPTFGPYVLLGTGGTYTEIWHDAVIRVLPLQRDEIAEMASHLQSFPILRGTRGQSPYDREALSRAIEAVSELMLRTQVQEVEMNPLRVFLADGGVWALDAKMVTSPHRIKEEIKREG